MARGLDCDDVTRLRALGANLLTVAISIGVMLALAEGVLRLAWDGYYLKQPGGYAQTDPVLGYANRPNLEMQYGEVEFSTRVVHNSFGFRGPEIPVDSLNI